MRTYTIVRNGTVKPEHIGEHHCGYATVPEYPYRVEVTVTGELRGPQYFIVANEELDECVQLTFKGQPSVSCEKMADMVVDGILNWFRSYAGQWTIEHIHCELTGTNGKANLSCDWSR